MNAITRYPGAKWGLAEWIISHFPAGYERMVYLEPFVGSGAVFLNKRPSVVETINDLDGDIVNLFLVLRDRPEELRRALELTPYSREEYDRAFEPCEDELEKARRYMVKTSQAIGAKLDGKCGWRNHKQADVGGTACKWHGLPGVVDMAAARLRGSPANLVQIEHMDALRLVERYNSPDVLMYLDPPHVPGARKSGRLYRHEMDEAGHHRLLELVTGSRANIILSGYASTLYDNALLPGWTRETTRARITSGAVAEEVLWFNYEPPCEQLSFELEDRQWT